MVTTAGRRVPADTTVKPTLKGSTGIDGIGYSATVIRSRSGAKELLSIVFAE
jgi:hypothetical protein